MPEATAGVMLATDVDKHAAATGHARYVVVAYDPKVDKPTDPVKMRCLVCGERRRHPRGPE
jgi:hypothetical protein